MVVRSWVEWPLSLHLREVTIVEITGLNPGHVYMVYDEIRANKLVLGSSFTQRQESGARKVRHERNV